MTIPTSPSETIQASSTNDLGTRFPGIVSAETRPSYKGWIVAKENLVEVATAIRDEFGYDLLSSLTGVDYFPENKMEVVYHAYKTTGGPGLVFKVQVPRENPVEVPSLINIWPGVELQERAAWDLLRTPRRASNRRTRQASSRMTGTAQEEHPTVRKQVPFRVGVPGSAWLDACFYESRSR